MGQHSLIVEIEDAIQCGADRLKKGGLAEQSRLLAPLTVSGLLTPRFWGVDGRFPREAVRGKTAKATKKKP